MKFSNIKIKLESDILKELELRAVCEGKSIDELIREAIKQFLKKSKAHKFKP